MNRRFSPAIVLLLGMMALLAASCSGSGFKVDGELEGMHNPRVRIAFMTDSGVVDEWVEMKQDGKFQYRYRQHVEDPVLITLMGMNSAVLCHAVVQDGDHISFKGDASKPTAVKASGNDLNERWQLFRDEHAAFYGDPNHSRLDASIEKYVRENPNDMLSTVLLMADYGDLTSRDKIEGMLNAINIKARPASLLRSFKTQATTSQRTPRLASLQLWHKGAIEQVPLLGHTTLFYLWVNNDDNRQSIVQSLKSLAQQAGDKVTIADVKIAADTLRWSQTIAADSATWKHYWAPGGPGWSAFRQLEINMVPWFVVTNNDGTVAYAGADVQQACRVAQERATTP